MNFNIDKAKLIAFAKGVAKAAVGAALVGAIAYARGHQAASPALYGAAVVALTEVYAALRERHYVTVREPRH